MHSVFSRWYGKRSSVTGRARRLLGPGLKTMSWLVASWASKIKLRLPLGLQLDYCTANCSATSLAFWPRIIVLKIVLMRHGWMWELIWGQLFHKSWEQCPQRWGREKRQSAYQPQGSFSRRSRKVTDAAYPVDRTEFWSERLPGGCVVTS